MKFGSFLDTINGKKWLNDASYSAEKNIESVAYQDC